MLAGRGAKVILECPAELRALFASIGGVQVIAPGEPLPEFDAHCALLSLAGLFETELHSIPAQTPYLRADGARVAAWRNRLARHEDWLKVGLCWTGSSIHRNDRNRSILVERLKPLLNVDGTTIVSLQKGTVASDLAAVAGAAEIIDAGPQLHDFADTAALVANLDLVISADTSVAHLAGAVGSPVWTLIPFAPDWRWLLDREDSPWYPTMRLFRQPGIGAWEPVIERVAEELRLRAARGGLRRAG
jgi:ADP-heptose:LPS heptosyltransferase